METLTNVSSPVATNSVSIKTIDATNSSGKVIDVVAQSGTMVPDKTNKGRCNLCGSECYKGINLLKQHIAGIRENMESCNENTLLD